MLNPRGEIVTATEDDIARFYGAIEFQSQWAARVLRKGSFVAGFGGLIEIEDGTWFAFFEVPAHLRKPSVYRHIVSAFNEAKAKGARIVKAHCNSAIPRAKELMERLGFEPTDEMINGKVVWACRVSN
ncbi:hypothetical protein [Rhizobium sp. 21-4511-3d]